MYERILVALDGSPLAEQVLPHVLALAEKLGSTVALLRALPPIERLVVPDPALAGPALDPVMLQEAVEAEEREAASYLEVVAAPFRDRGITVKWEHVEGPAATVLVEYARQEQIDLIALTTHGRSGLGRLVFGSVADEVLRKAPCPMLLVRARQASQG